METFRYMYLRDENKFPIAVVAYLIDRNECRATYGIATFNPDDKRVTFDRTFLREIAVGRLALYKRVAHFPKKQYNSLARINIAIVQQLRTEKDLPKRTRKAVDAWLDTASKSSYIDEDMEDDMIRH